MLVCADHLLRAAVDLSSWDEEDARGAPRTGAVPASAPAAAPSAQAAAAAEVARQEVARPGSVTGLRLVCISVHGQRELSWLPRCTCSCVICVCVQEAQ